MARALGTAYVNVRGRSDRLKGDLDKAHRMVDTSVKGIAKRVAGIGVAFAAVGASAAIAMRQVVELGRHFESTMKTVQAWSGANTNELMALTKQARLMGATTEWSAVQSAEALKFMAAAGFTAEQSVAALPAALDLATAGQVDLATATDITTDIMTAFGLSVEELKRVNDAFVTTASNSNTNILMMGASMKYAAPTARLFGLSIEQTAAMIGTLANSGIKAEMAGSGLNMVMLKMTKAAKMLGMDAMSPLIDVLRRMKKEQWGAMEISKAFGARQVKTASILMNNIGVYDDLLKKIKENVGATEKLSRIIRDSLDVDIKTLNSTIAESTLKIFDIYKDDIRDIVQFTTEWIRANEGLILQNLDAYIRSVGSALKVIKAIYDSLPDGMMTAAGGGLIGYILFGASGGAKIAVALYAINAGMSVFKLGIGDLVDAHRAAAEAIDNFYQALLGNRKGYAQDIRNLKIAAGQSLSQQGSPFIIPAEIVITPNSVDGNKIDPGSKDVSGGLASAIPDLKLMDAHVKEWKEYNKQLERTAAWKAKIYAFDAIAMGDTDMFMGLQEANERLVETFEETYNDIEGLTERTAWAMQENFSNVFYDAVTGKLKTFGDYAMSIFESVARAWSDMMGQMIAQGMFGSDFQGGGWLSELLAGAGSTYAPKYSDSSLISSSGAFPILKRAAGGPTYPGGTYLVGEQGPELLSMGTNRGFVNPNSSNAPNIQINFENKSGVDLEPDIRIMQPTPGTIIANAVLKRKVTSRGYRQALGVR